MNITGIITEYNPFHNGHQFHLEEARRITNADYVIAVMSPDYTQRGAPAFLDKHLRTEMALTAGVDLVLELPVEYAAASAEYFADGAVAILNQLNAVTHCCFGSESGRIDPLWIIAEILASEPADYQDNLKANLRNGHTYPAARRMALLSYLYQPELNPDEDWDAHLAAPNNILGIEYCKAICRQNSHIKPVTFKRMGSGYHNTLLETKLSSATAIRTALLEHGNLTAVENYIPPQVYQLLKQHWHCRGPVTEDDFSLLLKYRLLSETPASLIEYWDVSESLANRIGNNLNQFQSFSQFADLLKSKELTRTRINRALLHILLNIRKPEPIAHVRILGFRKASAPLLSHLKRTTAIPLVSKLDDKIYNPFAANLYESVCADKYKQVFRHEYTKPVVILP